MNDDEKRRQAASDIEIDFLEGTLTTLTINQHMFVKDNVAIAHPNSHRSAPTQPLCRWVFSEPATNQKIVGSQLQ